MQIKDLVEKLLTLDQEWGVYVQGDISHGLIDLCSIQLEADMAFGEKFVVIKPDWS